MALNLPFQNLMARPEGNSKISYAHPVNAGLRFSAVVMGNAMIDLSTGKSGTFIGTPPIVTQKGLVGPCLKFSSTSLDAQHFSNRINAAMPSFTMAAIYHCFDAAGSPYAFNNSAGGATGSCLRFGGNPSYDAYGNANIFSGLSASVGRAYLFVASTNPSVGNFGLLDIGSGKMTFSVTATFPAKYAGNGTYAVNRTPGGTLGISDFISAIVFSGSFISQSQMAQWFADPWGPWFEKHPVI